MTVKIAPDARRQFIDASGNPYSGGKLFYYAAGSTTKQDTYTTSAGSVANSNPIILDSAGRTPYGVWFTQGLTYKEVLAPSTDTDPPGSPIFTEDNLTGVGDAGVANTSSQWAASSLTPTYISTTSFSVPGDQTSELHVGRRLQLTVTAGTVYGRISASVFGAVTTVTLIMDSAQVLDSGLSSFNWSILTATNHAIPKLSDANWQGVNVLPLGGGTVTGATTFSSTLQVTGAITPSQTNGIVGTTTNNSANAGSVGEVISSSVSVGSPVALTTATGANVTSISLTAGDWDVFGNVYVRGTSTTNFNSLAGSSSTTTATVDNTAGFNHVAAPFVPGAQFDIGFPITTTRYSLSGTTTVYLAVRATFSASTLSAYGTISARRRR